MRARDVCGKCKRTRVVGGYLKFDVCVTSVSLPHMMANPPPQQVHMTVSVPICRRCWQQFNLKVKQPPGPFVNLAFRGFEKKLTQRQMRVALNRLKRREEAQRKVDLEVRREVDSTERGDEL